MRGVRLPEPIDVYGFRWPAQVGDRASKRVWSLIEQEGGKVKVEDAGIGVFRARDVEGDWYVWVVDFRVGLMEQSALLRGLGNGGGWAAGEKVEPDRATAEMLVMRHLRHVVSGGGKSTSTKTHWGLGALLDGEGGAHPIVGGDG